MPENEEGSNSNPVKPDRGKNKKSEFTRPRSRPRSYAPTYLLCVHPRLNTAENAEARKAAAEQPACTEQEKGQA